jgi:diguanylate cyclase (GGDEF)-like protein
VSELPLAPSVIGFAFVVALAVLGVFASNAIRAHDLAETVAYREAQNLAESLAQEAADTFEAVDGVLLAVATRVETGGTTDAERMSLQASMAAIVSTMPRLEGLLIIDERGRLVVSNTSAALRPDLRLDRMPYFLYHRAHPGAAVRISKPVRSETENVTVIEVTRRLEHPDGRFAGVAVAHIALAYFEHGYASVDIGPSGVISLIADDRTVIVRRPSIGLGRNVRRAVIFTSDLRYRSSGTFASVSPVDHVARIGAFRRLDLYPLVVVASLAQADVLADWRRDTLENLIALSVVIVMIAGLAHGLAGQFARRRRAEEILAHMALADGLTGLPNRRQFDTVLEREWRTAVRDRVAIALLMIDVDNFKTYNDRYGHLHGDDALTSIACTIEANVVRPRDLAARYGGEEFAVILPATQSASATIVAERIRHAVEALGIPHEDSPHLIVSVSIGVASVVPHAGEDRAQLIARADRALYAAKNAGRNRTLDEGPHDRIPSAVDASATAIDAHAVPADRPPAVTARVNQQIQS